MGCSDFEESVLKFNNKLRGLNQEKIGKNGSIANISLNYIGENSIKETNEPRLLIKNLSQKISNEKGIDICELKDQDNESNDLCYLKLSEKYTGNYYCNYFSDESLKSDCRTEWAIKNNDTSYCDIQPIEYAITCYNKFVEMKKSISICNKIIDLKLKKCLSEVNFTTNIEKRKIFCDGEDKINSLNECMLRLAIATLDKGWCVKSYNDEECYSTYGEYALDKTACFRIDNNVSLQAECYTYIAKQKEDKNLCEEIGKNVNTDEESYQKCIDDIQKCVNNLGYGENRGLCNRECDTGQLSNRLKTKCRQNFS